MKFELDLDGFMRALSEQDALDATRKKAEAVVTEARLTGPRNPRHHTHEIDKLAVGESRVTTEGAVTAIDWDSPWWHLLERGSVNNPPYRPLTRSAQDNGLRVTDF